MPKMTLAEKQEFRDAYKAAYLATASGKEYTLSTGGTSRTVKREDSEKMRQEYLFWDGEVTKAEAGNSGIKTKFITPAW